MLRLPIHGWMRSGEFCVMKIISTCANFNARERVSSEREWQPTKLNVDKQRWARAHRSTAHRTPDVWDLISHGFITDQIHTANSSSLSLSLSSKLDMILRTVETQINDKLQIQFPLAISTFLFFMIPTGGFSLVQRHFCINITQYHQLIQFHKNVCAFFSNSKIAATWHWCDFSASYLEKIGSGTWNLMPINSSMSKSWRKKYLTL